MPMPVRPLVAVLIASLVFVAAPLGAAPAARLPSWQDFYRIVHPALVRQEVIDPRRALVHLACLCEGDRVELLRPLRADPMETRRRRQAHQAAMARPRKTRHRP